MMKNRFKNTSLSGLADKVADINPRNRDFLPDVEHYFKAKELYGSNMDDEETKIDFHLAYMSLYQDFKISMHAKEISKEEFYTLVDIANERW